MILKSLLEVYRLSVLQRVSRSTRVMNHMADDKFTTVIRLNERSTKGLWVGRHFERSKQVDKEVPLTGVRPRPLDTHKLSLAGAPTPTLNTVLVPFKSSWCESWQWFQQSKRYSASFNSSWKYNLRIRFGEEIKPSLIPQLKTFENYYIKQIWIQEQNNNWLNNFDQ